MKNFNDSLQEAINEARKDSSKEAKDFLSYIQDVNPTSRYQIAVHFRNGFGQYNPFAEMVAGESYQIDRNFTKRFVNANRYGQQIATFIENYGKWKLLWSPDNIRYTDTDALDKFNGSPVSTK